MKNILTILGLTMVLIFVSIVTAFAEETTSEAKPPITQQELKAMVENWMNSPDEDDTQQRLDIMIAYYTFEEAGQKLSHDQEGLTLMNQIRKMVSIQIPKAELDELRHQVRIDLGLELETKSNSKHIPYKGVCAPGFVPLGEICVLNDRCGPGAYPGKICVMDGIEQPYLRPLQQKHAGLSIDNIICAEGKELIFKSNTSAPACVNSDSIDKLKNRGWQTTKPNMACTLEYNPMCGVDGVTYGNPCMLHASYMALKHQGECTDIMEKTKGIFEKTLEYTNQAPIIDDEKGYFVTEIADGIYWLVSSGYQTMFVTTGEGVIVVDAPQPISEKYIQAISDVTSEPITHMIYSHHHQDHTGAAGQIFPDDITFISHKETADVLAQESDPNRPVPNETFDDVMYTLTVGEQTLELHHLGNFHSNGDILILAPEQKVAMLVDLFRPDAAPYRAFGVTPNIPLYIETHDTLQGFDFDVLISGHTGILATKDHIKTNRQFTLNVMENAEQVMQVIDSDATQTCVQLTTEQWQGKLEGLDTFMVDHCAAMIEFVSKE